MPNDILEQQLIYSQITYQKNEQSSIQTYNPNFIPNERSIYISIYMYVLCVSDTQKNKTEHRTSQLYHKATYASMNKHNFLVKFALILT